MNMSIVLSTSWTKYSASFIVPKNKKFAWNPRLISSPLFLFKAAIVRTKSTTKIEDYNHHHDAFPDPQTIEELNIHPNLKKSLIQKKKMKTLTEIQSKAIPIILNCQDTLITSETGSGKTFTYLIPTLHKLMTINELETPTSINANKPLLIYSKLSPRALIIVPTRELVQQILTVLAELKTPELQFSATNFPPSQGLPSSQLTASSKDIAVTTLGGLVEFLNIKKPQYAQRIAQFLSRTETVIFDECDFVLNQESGAFLAKQKSFRKLIPNSFSSSTISDVSSHVSRLVSSNANDTTKSTTRTVESPTFQKQIFDINSNLQHKSRNKTQYIFVCATLAPKRHEKSKTPSALIEKCYPDTIFVTSKNVHKIPHKIEECFISIPSFLPRLYDSEKRNSSGNASASGNGQQRQYNLTRNANQIKKNILIDMIKGKITKDSLQSNLPCHKNEKEENKNESELRKKKGDEHGVVINRQESETWLVFSNSAKQVNELYDELDLMFKTEQDLGQIMIDKIHAELPRLMKGQIVAKYIDSYSYYSINHANTTDSSSEDNVINSVDHNFSNSKSIIDKYLKESNLNDNELAIDVETKIAKNNYSPVLKILICTDVVGRGIDFHDVYRVIHFDFPETPTTYIHRVGRTARAGRRGESIAFVTENEKRLASLLEMASKGEGNRKLNSSFNDLNETLNEKDAAGLASEPGNGVMLLAEDDGSFKNDDDNQKKKRNLFFMGEKRPLNNAMMKLQLTALLQPRGKLQRSLKSRQS